MVCLWKLKAEAVGAQPTTDRLADMMASRWADNMAVSNSECHVSTVPTKSVEKMVFMEAF